MQKAENAKPDGRSVKASTPRSLPGPLLDSVSTCSLAMGSNYVFSLQPTFTQGLILGQLSILVLLALILKYLFIDSSESPIETSSYHPRLDNEPPMRSRHKLASHDTDDDDSANETSNESADWFNTILQQVRFISVHLWWQEIDDREVR